MSGSRIYRDQLVGDVIIRKSERARRISIKVHPLRGVSVTVPSLVPYKAAEAFFRLKREWVIETVAKQKSRFGNVTRPSDGEIERLRKAAKEVLPVRLKELAGRYGFTYGKVTVKHNLTNWGSCSTRGNINLNLNIMRLPKVLRDYILLHELCHLRHHDHGHAFHLLLEHLLSDNLLKLLDAETGAEREFISELARKAALSGARYPIDHTMTHAIRQYPLM